jgi:hypothetical protein
MYQRKDFQWRYAPKRESSSGVLLAYIDEKELHPNREKKQMMLAALNAYYLPLAYLALGKSRSEVERVGWDSVLALLEQVNFLCSVLGLERKSLGSEVRGNLSSAESISKKQGNPLPGGSTASTQPEPLNKAGLSKFRFSYAPGEDLSSAPGGKLP